MANRHLSRSIALQTLFESDFNGRSTVQLPAIIKRNIEEFAPGIDDVGFINDLIMGVVEKQVELDDIIVKAAPEWPLDKIATVDRNILRIGLYELLFANRGEVPARVAINEAIELAKTFGGESSGKFVNGVLGTVYKEIGEPGKNDVPLKKKRAPIDLANLPVETLGGAVVYTEEQGGVYLALVHDIFGYWTLSKGHIEEGEDPQTATLREVKEELSLDIRIKEKLADNEYLASHPEKGKVKKRVSYFLAQAPSREGLRLNKDQGLDDARWFELAQVADLKMYDDIVPIVTKAVNILNGSN